MIDSPFSWLANQDTAPRHGDAAFLARALMEARRGVGRTAPNPPVGAVLVKDGAVIATGFHARAGERHAEVVALDEVAGQARGATLYVTLEPCAHHGRTPPCVDRIIAEGVARVVVGAADPNPRVIGGGIELLRAAGVEVALTGEAGLAREATALIAPFASIMMRARPWVVLKVATSLDGRVATKNGRSRWITGPEARALVHQLRDAVDAVMVGSGTALADDPALTVRDAPVRADGDARRDPVRVVIDGALRCDPHGRVFGPAGLVVHAAAAPAERARLFDQAFVARVAVGDSRVQLRGALEALSARGLCSVLVEGGPGLATALWRERLVDELWWFTAPRVLGGDAVEALGALQLASPDDAARLTAATDRTFSDGDRLQILLS